MAEKGELLFIEKIRFPIYNTRFNSKKNIIFWRIAFSLAIIISILIFVYNLKIYLTEPKYNTMTFPAIGIFIFLWASLLYLTKRILYASIPIRIYSDTIYMPTSFFENRILKRGKISIINIKKIYTDFSEISGAKLSDRKINKKGEFLDNQLIIETKDQRKYISGPKEIKQIMKIKRIINKNWPDLLEN